MAQSDFDSAPAGEVIPAPGHPDLLVIEGKLDTGIAKSFAEVLKANPKATTVVLDSGGGLLDEGVFLARIIRANHLDTVILPENECESACAFAFLGGVNRKALGKFGVHQAFQTSYPDPAAAVMGIQLSLADVLDIFIQAKVSPVLFRRMLSTAPPDILVLTASELVAYGVNAGKVRWLDATIFRE